MANKNCKNLFIKIFVLLNIIFFIISSIILLRISYLPFELVKQHLDTFAADGSADVFRETLFRQIVIHLRVIAIVIFFISLLLYISRRQIQQYIYDVLVSFSFFVKDIIQYFNEIIRRKEEKIYFFVLFIILLIGITVRLKFLFQPMRYDEACTFLRYASMPLYIGLSNYSFPHTNNHLFHTFLVHIAYLLFGNKPWVIRLPALFFGILLIPTSYLMIRIFYNKYAGLLTAGIVASSSALIEYSTNARGYTLICLIFLLIIVLGKYLMQNRNPSVWLLFTILSAIGFYTIPIMLYPFGIVITFLFLSIIFKDTSIPRNLILKDLFTYLIIIIILTFILYVPVFIANGLKTVIANPFITPLPWSYFVTQFPDSIRSVWAQWNRDIPPGIILLFIIGFFVSLILHKHLSIHRIPIILAVCIWCIPILIIHRVVPYPRVWLFLLPLYIGLGSSGITYPLRLIESKLTNYKPILFGILVIILSLYLGLNVIRSNLIFYPDPPSAFNVEKDAEQITIFLGKYLKPGDIILCIGGSNLVLEYYFNIYNVPIKYLDYELINPTEIQRILIITNKTNYQIFLQSFLKQKRLLNIPLSPHKIIKRYEFATIYEIDIK